MIGSLDGTGTVSMRDGAVAGFDIDRVASRLDRADTQKELNELLNKSMSSGQTRIDRLAGALRIDKGVIRTDDLKATAPSADMTGKGSADLTNWNLDLALAIRLTAEADLPAFGLTLTGPLDRPKPRWMRRPSSAGWNSVRPTAVAGELRRPVPCRPTPSSYPCSPLRCADPLDQPGMRF